MDAQLVFDARNVVGESLIWDDRRNRLVWVDIIGRRIHAINPDGTGHQSWQTPDIVTSIGLREDGGAIVGLRKFVALWNWGGSFEHLADVEPDMPGNRLNEGVVGPDGAFWVGTMQNNIGADDAPVDITADTGRLYRVSADGSVTRLSDDTFGITNTLVWPHETMLVTADTTKNEIYRYRWDAQAQRLLDRRVILAGHERGLPDGSCGDADGMVWNARVVGGNCVMRLSPDGTIDRLVELPCSWPTSCAFGGPGLDTLFVTSARFTMDDAHLAAHPIEGGLFALRTGVVGKPAYRFG